MAETVMHIVYKANIIAAFSVALFVGDVLGADDCPDGWTRDIKASRCIRLMDDTAMYDGAVDNCTNVGAELIKIENQYDQSVLECILRKETKSIKGYWIQMKRTSNSTWKFENGEVVSWFNWKIGQPNAKVWSNKACVSVGESIFQWHDRPCSEEATTLKYVCAKKYVRGPIIETRYQGQDNCLVEHSELRRYNAAEWKDPITTSDCVRDCTQDTCCASFASRQNGCILYMHDTSIKHPFCVDQTYKLYRKE